MLRLGKLSSFLNLRQRRIAVLKRVHTISKTSGDWVHISLIVGNVMAEKLNLLLLLGGEAVRNRKDSTLVYSVNLR